MAFGTPSWTALRRGMRYQFGSFEVRDFSGGLNLRDAPSEIAGNESPDMMNVTLDERGGIVKRLGQNQIGTLSNPATRMFWSQALNLGYIQDGTAIKTTSDFVTYTTMTTAMSTTARVGFAEFAGVVCIVHPVDGLFTHPGSGNVITAVGAGPKGNAATAWQSKLWVVGDPTHPQRVWFSGANSATDWTVGGAGGSGWVEIRDNNDAPVTAVGTGTALDFTALPSLLVFKARSTHRINNSTTGSYQTIDARAGASGPMATTSAIGRVVFVNDLGVWESDGIHEPSLASAKLQPLFTSTQLNLSAMSGALVTSIGQRVLISLPFGAAQTTNNLTLEFNPLLGWFASHDFGLGCAYPYLKNTSKLYGGHPTVARVNDIFTTPTDNGSVIAARLQTRWFTPAGDNQCRVQRIRLFGRGIFQLYYKTDYQVGDGLLNNVAITNNGFQWNAVNWNAANAIWGPLSYEGYQDFHALGVAKACSFLFKDTSTTAATGPNLLGGGAAPEVGGFACYGFQLNYAPLGLS